MKSSSVRRTRYAGIVWSLVALSAPAGAEPLASTQFELPEVRVISTTPVADTGIPVSQFPGNAQIINSKQIPDDARGLPDVLNQSIGSVNVNDTQGNPYQIDLNYRGFTASPVLGTPQGISVFLDGVRMNEPFGDVVSWDLIPQIAIANITLIPGSNPVYGLNTLGGAISMNTKSGFTFPGTDAKITAGSFGRASLDAEHGGHAEYTDYYLAASIYNDRGWAVYNPSKIRQLFGKVGFQDQKVDLDLSMMYADNAMYGNQTVPLSMLSDAAAGYTHPDSTRVHSFMLNLRGNLALNDNNLLGGNIYYRNIVRDILNSNVEELLSAADNNPGCAASGDCPASNLLAHYTQDVFGGNLQWSNMDKVWNRPQQMTIGVNAEYGRTNFSNLGQDAYVAGDFATIGVDPFVQQALIKSINRRFGLYATDTLSVTDRLALTASARYDYAAISLAGTSCNAGDLCDGAATVSPVPGVNTLADVSGVHSYRRLNPSLGLTYQLAAGLNGFANYSEGFRTPSAIELACADPSSPCTGLPNAFGADPDLTAVVAKTYEIGLRGNAGTDLRWRAAAFYSNLDNDIVFNQANAVSGYFSNVPQTRRQGLELSIDGQRKRFDYAASASWVHATFQSPFTIANGANSSCIAANGTGNGCAGVLAQPGDVIPGIPAVTVKLRLGYKVTPRTHVTATLQAQGPQYARGDENNQDINGRIPGFATVRLDLTHQVTKSIEVFAGVNNLFNNRYANFGVLSDNNLTTGNAEQFRNVAAPRSFYAGLRMRL
ncbi:MAG: TonB-dependent receptor [Burkholderiaceae bacterium]|jgi:outer membrane receptor protein involved in Fe transport|nr:MAG: TonB-dependent receptor [Burkholderiaceae bacterium]